MEDINSNKKSMRTVKEDYFAAPNEITVFWSDPMIFAPFYEQARRIAIEEGFRFDMDVTSEGFSGLTPGTAQVVIYSDRYDQCEPRELRTEEALELFSQPKVDNTVITGPCRTTIISYLDTDGFYLRRGQQYEKLEAKLRELYRIGYHVVKSEESFKVKEDELSKKKESEKSQFRVPITDFKTHVIHQMDRWTEQFGEAYLIDVQHMDHLVKNCTYPSDLINSAFREREKQIDEEIDTEKKRILIVPGDYIPVKGGQGEK
jgi:hypothetical protein